MIEDYFLDPDKLPSVLSGYHPRGVQIQAAKHIYNAIENYSPLAIEAPTGSGKTMAYLVGTYLHGRRTIISTKSKQLMQQLYLKDIPVMQKLFGERPVATLKGRKNYFCPHRFMRWIYPNKHFYQDVIDWFSMEQNDIMEVPRGIFDHSVVDKMTADSNQCLYGKCKYYTSCPFTKAKEIANEATVVITNHHLVLADIAMKASGSHGQVFEHADHIIFDEAHSISDIYSVYSGKEISLKRLLSIIGDHKEKLSVQTFAELNSTHAAILSHLNGQEGKVLYTDIEEQIHPFMEVCHKLVNDIDDEDLTMEFSHIDEAYKTLNVEKEGLKYAEIRPRDLLLKYIPLTIGGDFLEGLQQTAISPVFVSATLTTDNKEFDYFIRETGLENANLTTVALPSVFKLENQGILLVPKSYTSVDDTLYSIVSKIEGSVLIICNSISRMQYLSSYLNDKHADKPVFTQVDGDWSTFTAMGNIILIGCATLREGLDLAGGNFKCVIIDKLPFEYHKDLYLSEKAKNVEKTTGDSFNNFYLPRAVLYFKQAAGRLIRHESDKGVWVCMDDRIISKNYGKKFLNVLDDVCVTRNIDEAINFLER